MSHKISTSKTLKVAQVLEQNMSVVINAGAVEGIRLGQTYLVYRVGEEILDPDTRQPLGVLETVIGEGEITHVQERLSILESSRTIQTPKRILRRPSGFGVLGSMIESEEFEPVERKIAFKNPRVGDLVKRVN